MNRVNLWLRACGLFVLLSPMTKASNKALIVGIGKYQHACTQRYQTQPPCVNDLPGIELDVQRMHGVALSLGFSEEQIHILQNERATLEAIQTELNGWFKAGVGPNDHLLLYFSSHGSLVPGPHGDVGAIIPYDVRFGNRDLEVVLTGPVLADILETNPSRNIMLVVDACHSGGMTSTKGIQVRAPDFVPKVLTYEGMPQFDLTADLFTAGVPETKDAKQPNYAYLAACRRDEVAGATSRGSTLTLGLEQGWAELRRNRQKASLEAVHPVVSKMIVRMTEEYRKQHSEDMPLQHPEIYGDQTLLASDWFSAAPSNTASSAKLWDALENVNKASAGPLQVSADQAEYQQNSRLNLTINVPREGYLFVMSIGEGDDTPALLFPNKWISNNHVSPGVIQLPEKEDDPIKRWKITQKLPAGMKQQKALVVVVLSHSPDMLKDLTSGNGPFKDVYLPDTRSPVAEAADAEEGYLAGRITYVIKDY